MRSRNGRLVCITCQTANARVQGKLQSVAWQNGTAELSRPQAVEASEPQQQDEILPEGSAVEALTDGAGTETPIPASNRPAPRRRAAEPRERPLPATPVQPQDIPLSDALL